MATVPKKVKELLEKIPTLLNEISRAEIIRAAELQAMSDELQRAVEGLAVSD